MLTVYCKPEDVSNHKVVDNFPNPNIRKCVDKNGREYFLQIVKPTDDFFIRELSESEVR